MMRNSGGQGRNLRPSKTGATLTMEWWETYLPYNVPLNVQADRAIFSSCELFDTTGTRAKRNRARLRQSVWYTVKSQVCLLLSDVDVCDTKLLRSFYVVCAMETP